MLSLAFSPESLEVQRKVVCEEFKEHYINKPYGDVWHKLRELSYTQHPYRWMTIGKELSHIEQASLEDVKSFFFKHYTPSNAILVVGGPLDTATVKPLVEKWFGEIPSGKKYLRSSIPEPKQTAARAFDTSAAVPLDGFFKTWHMADRLSPNYQVADLLTEIIGNGGSSRLYNKLVKEKQLFSNISCYHLGSVENGLVTIEGKLVKGVKMAEAEKAVDDEISLLLDNGVSASELEKAKNRTESMLAFEDLELMSRCNNLAFYELLGNADDMNTEWEKYSSVSLDDMKNVAAAIFDSNNSNTMHYYAENK